MSVPTDLRYTKDHEWVRLDGDVATVGVTAYAAGRLGDIVFVELPEVGRSIDQFAAFGVVELTAVTTRLANANSDAVIAIFLGGAACYLALTLPSGWLAGRLERRVAVAR